MSRHNVCCQSLDTEKRIFCASEVIRIEKIKFSLLFLLFKIVDVRLLTEMI